METLFLSIEYKDPLWITIAFVFGMASRSIGLPPLVGFLAAGFALNYFGVEGGAFLNELADLGVTLLLFTIGLKLRAKELMRAEILGVTIIHTLSITAISTLGVLILGKMGVPLFQELTIVSALLIGFALSFSSTVFVVKILENHGDFLSQYGRLAIGVLIVQDIAAVVFLGISEAKVPSLWAALMIVALFVGRPLLIKLLAKIGHDELLILYGLVLALGGASLFEAVDMKADLGALIFGVLLASHPKSSELAKTLFSLKELFLVGFFLSIGMAGLPNVSVLIAAALLLVGLTAKTGLFHFLFSVFKVRARSATFSSLVLGNYSEFGLIVIAVAVSHNWLPKEWLVVMAVLVSSSFAVSSAFNNYSENIFARFRNHLRRFQRKARLPGDEDIDATGIKILVCGMGRVGRSAFQQLVRQGKTDILGLDFDDRVVQEQCSQGLRTSQADVSSPDFWHRLDVAKNQIEWILLCITNAHASAQAAGLVRNLGYKGFISASTEYTDEEGILLEVGVDAVFNIYAEAGAGLTQLSQEFMD